MPEIKSFEDKFDHDPNSRKEEEEDWDLGPDDEFAGNHAKPASLRKKRDIPKGGCLFSLFKISLSIGILAGFYFYIFRPEEFSAIQSNLQNKITEITAVKPDSKAPALPFKTTAPRTTERTVAPVARPEPKVPAMKADAPVLLNGSGELPDFVTIAKRKPSLNNYLAMADKMTFETMDTYHKLVKDMIADWAEETDKQKIAEKVQMPYKHFFNRTSASLLSQTLLKKSGLTPSDTDRMIVESPVQAMAFLYPFLKNAMAVKTTVPDQVRTIEPVSSFLIYICHDESECMASWDLLIDMLGAKQFSKRLEQAPETIYTEK